MERTLTQEDRIRRAQEIYLRKRLNRENTIAPRKVTRECTKKQYPTIKGLKLFKRVALQIVICLLLYCIFYLIYDTNYSFSEATINKTAEILNYDINFETMYKYINETIMSVFQKSNNGEEKNNEEIEEPKEEIKEEQTANNEEPKEEEKTVQKEESVEENKEEEPKENGLILPVSGGYVSSEFGERESTSEIVSTNHKGIDIAVIERYRSARSNVWKCYKVNRI